MSGGQQDGRGCSKDTTQSYGESGASVDETESIYQGRQLSAIGWKFAHIRAAVFMPTGRQQRGHSTTSTSGT